MTDVTVTTPPSGGAHAAPDLPAPSPGPRPAAAAGTGSPLAALRERRARLLDKLYVDLRVPRWGDHGDGPRIYVRYTAAQPSEFGDRIEKAQRRANKPKDWAVIENAQMLVSCCQGVWAWEGEDDPPDRPPADDADAARVRARQLSLRDGDPHGAWTRFDPDLAYSLGLEENCGAIAVVRALYLTEADITTTANAVLRWSGMSLPQDGQGFFGS